MKSSIFKSAYLYFIIKYLDIIFYLFSFLFAFLLRLLDIRNHQFFTENRERRD